MTKMYGGTLLAPKRLVFERVQTVSIIIDVPVGMPEKDINWWANHGRSSRSPLDTPSMFPFAADYTKAVGDWKLAPNTTKPPARNRAKAEVT